MDADAAKSSETLEAAVSTKDAVVRLEEAKKSHQRLRLILLSVVAILLFLLLIALVVLLVVILRKSPKSESVEFYNLNKGWQSCQRTCTKKFSTPPLLVISFDGFQAGYLSRGLSPAVQNIFDCGSRAEYILPSYPSITFPNHYTIVTGLYPESHGIIANRFYDETVLGESTFLKSTRNPEWWKGEPIWNTVRKNGKNATVFFWPGSEVPIQGISPPAYLSFNSTVPFSQRVDNVLKWLLNPSEDIPAFISMYFEEPDTSGHKEGPNSDKVNSAIIYVDAMLNYLMAELHRNGLLGCINIVIVSDHGMQQVREDQKVYFEDFLNVTDPNAKLEVGSLGRLKFADEKKANISGILNHDLLKCTEGKLFRVYDRRSAPKRFHYTDNERIGSILLDPSEGTEFYLDRSQKWDGKGDHGYDNRLKSMRAIFGATGPSVRNGITVPPFQNIELYNFFVDLLELSSSAPNNGTKGVLDALLQKAPKRDETPMTTVPACEDHNTYTCGHSCPRIQLISSSSKECDMLSAFQVPTALAQGAFCAVNLCNASLLVDQKLQSAKMAISVLGSPIPNIDHRSDCRVAVSSIANEDNLKNCSNANRASTVSLFSDDDNNRFIVDAQFALEPKFINGIWKDLLTLIRTYRKHYKQLVMYSGPIYDFESNGKFIGDEEILKRSLTPSPTHFFVVLFRCSDNLWNSSRIACTNPQSSRVISFLLPTIAEDYNCLFPEEYLFHHTGRIRDVELATGIEFFSDRTQFDARTAIGLRNELTEELWQMEVSDL